MNDLPRQKLVEIVERHGKAVIEDARRCEGLFRDYFGEYRREIAVLIMAVKEGVARDMFIAPKNTPRGVLLARLTRRLCDNLALAEPAASWAVNSWALALGFISNEDLKTVEAEVLDKVKTVSALSATDTLQIVKNNAAQVPVSPKTSLIVSTVGDGDFLSISEAIKAANVGTKILVRPGTYAENLVLDKQVDIVGDGSAEEIIIESSVASCINMQSEKASMRNLTLTGLGGQSGKAFFAVDIGRGELLLENCYITSDTLSCVAIYGASTNPLIKGCSIYGGADSGIYIFNKALGRIEDCDVFRNRNVGVAITGGSNPLIKNCRIFEGDNAGIVCWLGGAGIIEDCEIYGNALANFGISEEADPIIRRCRIYNGRNSGVYVHKRGHGTIEDCDIFGHAEAEVAATTGGDPVLRGCSLHNSNNSGVHVRNQGRALIENCNIFDNAYAGVTIDNESLVAIRNCNINRNEKVAVSVKGNSIVRVENSDLRQNLIATWETEGGVTVEKINNKEY